MNRQQIDDLQPSYEFQILFETPPLFFTRYDFRMIHLHKFIKKYEKDH